jgi:hypothetical protein
MENKQLTKADQHHVRTNINLNNKLQETLEANKQLEKRINMDKAKMRRKDNEIETKILAAR